MRRPRGEIAEAMRAIAANPRLRNVLSGCGLARAAPFRGAGQRGKHARCTVPFSQRGDESQTASEVLILRPSRLIRWMAGAHSAWRRCRIISRGLPRWIWCCYRTADGPAELPEGLVRSQHVIPLPHHSRAGAARYLRNARRAMRGVPPLIDRLARAGGD